MTNEITIKTNNTEKLTFEIVDSVPVGYEIWNISMPENHKNVLPLYKSKNYPYVDVNSLKAILINGADKVTSASGRIKHEGNPLKAMQIYCKKYTNAKSALAHYKVRIFAEAIPILKKIKWD